MNNGWRTIVIQGTVKLSIRDNRLVLNDIKEHTEKYFALDEIARVIIMSLNGIITTAVLRELAERNVTVIICSKHFEPLAELSDYRLHEELAGAIMDQASWSQERKDAVWAEIVRSKIANQIRLLEICGKDVTDLLHNYLKEVKPGDPTNREGQAARVYFRSLFGPGFRRHAPDDVNAVLNYGYALLRSYISRALSAYGYHTALGIHHNSRNNKFNLSCDLMESFRPFIDRIAFSRIGHPFDKTIKTELVLNFQNNCIYNGKTMSIENALEEYTLNTVKMISDGRKEFRGVEFE